MLAPYPSAFLERDIARPKTPAAQLGSLFDAPGMYSGHFHHTQLHHASTINRPSSAWSDVSDSSLSSLDSSVSLPSHAETCISADSEHDDPFVSSQIPSLDACALASPMQPTRRRPRRSRSSQSESRWAPEMDEHLWLTYVTYSSDPTVTPFKMLPGTAPPLGVCHRVARQAKRSWKGVRLSLRSIDEDRATRDRAQFLRRRSMNWSTMSPNSRSDTLPCSSPVPRSHSSGEVVKRTPQAWPQSASATRRRLRDLCKKKTFIPTHYQRLIQARTPSPFEPATMHRASHDTKIPSPPDLVPGAVFSTRDLNIGLTASTAASMQPNGPLAQLATSQNNHHPSAATGRPPTGLVGHQKSQSMQVTPNWLLQQQHVSHDRRKLASPFQEKAHHPYTRGTPATSSFEAGNQPGMIGVQGIEIHAPQPLSGSMKRRTQHALGQDMLSPPRGDVLQELFHKPLDDGTQRVRSRGFSMSAMRQPSGSRQLSDVFGPRSHELVRDAQSRASGDRLGNALLHAPTGFGSARLGSPFSPSTTQTTFSRTFPRSSFPLGLDSLSSLHDPFTTEHPSSTSSGCR